MATANVDKRVKKTQVFYNRYPLSDASFRSGASILKMEDIQVSPEELEGKRILDAGCGPGNISMHIASSAENVNLVSMDIAGDSVNILKERLEGVETGNRTEQVLGSVLRPPFEEESFDFVVTSGVVHHTPEPFTALDNLGTVLKRGGKMYMSVYNRNSFYFTEFHTLGRVCRFIDRSGNTILTGFFITVFQFALRVISGENVSRPHAERIFADRYLTPVASFHTVSQIRRWCRRNGFRILKEGTCKLATLIWFLVGKG